MNSHYSKIPFHGNSMLPFVRDGDVLLCKKVYEYQLGDIVIFYDGDELVAHRIVCLSPLQIKGDRSKVFDNIDSFDNILECVVGIQRNGQEVELNQNDFKRKIISSLSLLNKSESPFRKVIIVIIWLASKVF